MSFYEQNTIVLSQKNNLLNHAVNCEIFRKNILHAKYFAKYSKPAQKTQPSNSVFKLNLLYNFILKDIKTDCCITCIQNKIAC